MLANAVQRKMAKAKLRSEPTAVTDLSAAPPVEGSTLTELEGPVTVPEPPVVVALIPVGWPETAEEVTVTREMPAFRDEMAAVLVLYAEPVMVLETTTPVCSEIATTS